MTAEHILVQNAQGRNTTPIYYLLPSLGCSNLVQGCFWTQCYGTRKDEFLRLIWLQSPYMNSRSFRNAGLVEIVCQNMCVRQDLKGKSYHTQIRIIWKEFIYKRDWLPRCVHVVLVVTREKEGRNLEPQQKQAFQHPQSWMVNGKEILPESRKNIS